MGIQHITPSTRPKEALENTKLLLESSLRSTEWKACADVELEHLWNFWREGTERLKIAQTDRDKEHIKSLCGQLFDARKQLEIAASIPNSDERATQMRFLRLAEAKLGSTIDIQKLIAQEANTSRYSLVCPKCKAQEWQDVANDLAYESLTCSKCKTQYITRIVSIRAKRSTGNRSSNSRRFSVRIIDADGDESLVEFVKAGWDDYELRAKDKVAFTQLNQELRIVQNLTIGVYYVVSKPSCYIATHVFGVSSPEVARLREFRDSSLLNASWSAHLVYIYYSLSPLLIRNLGKYRAFNDFSRIAIKLLLRQLR